MPAPPSPRRLDVWLDARKVGELREQGNTLPFILLTGDAPDGLRASEPRLDACLLKDFSLDETLPQVIRDVLARYGKACDGNLSISHGD